jgi:hypothetical protein
MSYLVTTFLGAAGLLLIERVFRLQLRGRLLLALLILTWGVFQASQSAQVNPGHPIALLLGNTAGLLATITVWFLLSHWTRETPNRRSTITSQ